MNKFFIALVLMTLIGCASAPKLQTIMPEKTSPELLKYEFLTSFLHLPVSIKIKEVESQINKFLKDKIYEDLNIEDDDIKATVIKTSEIKVTQINQNIIEIKLPLKINATYRIGTEKLGIKLYDYKTFDLNGVFTLQSNIKLNNFKLDSSTKIVDISWTESPTMEVLGKKVPITYLINPTLKIFKSKMEKTINEKMNELMDFKPYVIDALEKLSKPILTHEGYQTWFRFSPLEVYTKEAVISKEKIDIEMGLKATLETLIGSEPKQKFDKNAIVFKPVKSMPEKILANVVAVSTYEEASKIIQKNFGGQTFGDGNNQVTVNKINLWHNKGKVVIALDVVGKVNGVVYLKGVPKYSAEDTSIYFDDLDFVLDTKNILHKSAAWLLNGKILKMIKEKSRYSIAPNMDEGKKTMLNYLNNYSPMKGVFINGQLNHLSFENIQIHEKGFVAFLKGEGQVKIDIDGLE
jgi:hypothetical protein